MRVTLAQIAPKLGRLDDNVHLHRQIIADAWTGGSELVIFPELSLTGYLLRDYVAQVALPATELPGLFDGLGVGRQSSLDAVLGFVELSPGRHCYSAAAYLRFEPGRQPALLKVHRKVHLPTYGMFDEQRYFTAGRSFRAFDSPLLGRTGLLICEDLWHPSSVYVLSIDGPAYEGIQTLIGISNSPARGIDDTQRDTLANIEIWRRLNAVHALVFGLVVFQVQRVGVEDSYIYSGGSEVLLPNGEPLARAPLLDEHLLTVELDLAEELRWQRSANPMALAADVDLIRRELARIAGEAFS